MKTTYDVVIMSRNKIITDVGAVAKDARNAVLNVLRKKEVKAKLDGVNSIEIIVSIAKEYKND